MPVNADALIAVDVEPPVNLFSPTLFSAALDKQLIVAMGSESAKQKAIDGVVLASSGLQHKFRAAQTLVQALTMTRADLLKGSSSNRILMYEFGFRPIDQKVHSAQIFLPYFETLALTNKLQPGRHNFNCFFELVEGIAKVDTVAFSEDETRFLNRISQNLAIPTDNPSFKFNYLAHHSSNTGSCPSTSTETMINQPNTFSKRQLFEDVRQSRTRFVSLFKALKAFFSEDEVEYVFTVLAAILHLGNVDIIEPKAGSSFTGGCTIRQDIWAYHPQKLISPGGTQRSNHMSPFHLVARLLKIDAHVLKLALLQHNKHSLKVAECLEARDSLARQLFAKLIDWIFSRVNTDLASQSHSDNLKRLGVLDLPAMNLSDTWHGFEHLCVNYVNEKFHMELLGKHSHSNQEFEAVRLLDNTKSGMFGTINADYGRFDFAHNPQLLVEKVVAKHNIPMTESQFTLQHFGDQNVQYSTADLFIANKDTYEQPLLQYLQAEVSMIPEKDQLSCLKETVAAERYRNSVFLKQVDFSKTKKVASEFRGGYFLKRISELVAIVRKTAHKFAFFVDVKDTNIGLRSQIRSLNLDAYVGTGGARGFKASRSNSRISLISKSNSNLSVHRSITQLNQLARSTSSTHALGTRASNDNLKGTTRVSSAQRIAQLEPKSPAVAPERRSTELLGAITSSTTPELRGVAGMHSANTRSEETLQSSVTIPDQVSPLTQQKMEAIKEQYWQLMQNMTSPAHIDSACNEIITDPVETESSTRSGDLLPPTDAAPVPPLIPLLQNLELQNISAELPPPLRSPMSEKSNPIETASILTDDLVISDSVANLSFDPPPPIPSPKIPKSQSVTSHQTSSSASSSLSSAKYDSNTSLPLTITSLKDPDTGPIPETVGSAPSSATGSAVIYGSNSHIASIESEDELSKPKPVPPPRKRTISKPTQPNISSPLAGGVSPLSPLVQSADEASQQDEAGAAILPAVTEDDANPPDDQPPQPPASYMLNYSQFSLTRSVDDLFEKESSVVASNYDSLDEVDPNTQNSTLSRQADSTRQAQQPIQHQQDTLVSRVLTNLESTHSQPGTAKRRPSQMTAMKDRSVWLSELIRTATLKQVFELNTAIKTQRPDLYAETDDDDLNVRAKLAERVVEILFGSSAASVTGGLQSGQEESFRLMIPFCRPSVLKLYQLNDPANTMTKSSTSVTLQIPKGYLLLEYKFSPAAGKYVVRRQVEIFPNFHQQSHSVLASVTTTDDSEAGNAEQKMFPMRLPPILQGSLQYFKDRLAALTDGERVKQMQEIKSLVGRGIITVVTPQSHTSSQPGVSGSMALDLGPVQAKELLDIVQVSSQSRRSRNPDDDDDHSSGQQQLAQIGCRLLNAGVFERVWSACLELGSQFHARHFGPVGTGSATAHQSQNSVGVATGSAGVSAASLPAVPKPKEIII